MGRFTIWKKTNRKVRAVVRRKDEGLLRVKDGSKRKRRKMTVFYRDGIKLDRRGKHE